MCGFLIKNSNGGYKCLGQQRSQRHCPQGTQPELANPVKMLETKPVMTRTGIDTCVIQTNKRYFCDVNPSFCQKALLMKQLVLFLLLFLTKGSLPAQWIYYDSFSGLEIAPCPFDANKINQQIGGWVIYQTLNGNWDGPVDSSRCISAEKNADIGTTFIRLSQVDPTRPLFLRAKPESIQNADLKLWPNSLYSIQAAIGLSPTDGPTLQTGTDCFQDLCSGVFVGLAIPGPDGQVDAARRFHTGLFAPQPGYPRAYGAESCFPSEKFDTQSVSDLVLKLTFAPSANWSTQILKLSAISVEFTDPFPTLIEQVYALPKHLHGLEYTINVDETASGFSPAYLMPYTAPTYPSAQNPSYIEARPEPNSGTPQTINLYVGLFEILQIQPFTYLRGALVQGSDSIRHRANLLNDGGDICINFLDLVFANGDEYRHAGGQISMNNAFSCLQFREKSALRVMENATLHYGEGGTGMLALCAGSHLVLEKNATFIMDGILNVAECDLPYTDANITVDLHPGSTLSFTPQAFLTNRFSKNQQLRLKARMLGGRIDDSALDPAEQSLIERVYPKPATSFAQNIALQPNPITAEATLQYLAAEAEVLDLQWFDTNGQWIQQQSLTVDKGINQQALKVPERKGLYLLKIANPKQHTTLKVLRF